MPPPTNASWSRCYKARTILCHASSTRTSTRATRPPSRHSRRKGCEHRAIKYLNNVIEQDHRAIKHRVKAGGHLRALAARQRRWQATKPCTFYARARLPRCRRETCGHKTASSKSSLALRHKGKLRHLMVQPCLTSKACNTTQLTALTIQIVMVPLRYAILS